MVVVTFLVAGVVEPLLELSCGLHDTTETSCPHLGFFIQAELLLMGTMATSILQSLIDDPQ